MNRLWDAPHRAAFFFGGLGAVLALAWWAAEMVMRLHGGSTHSAIPVMWLHADLMLFGFFPLFMLGFIYTAGPKWLNVAPPPLNAWAPAILGYTTGTVLQLIALRWPVAWSLGDAMHWIAWVGATILWIGRIRASRAPDKKHATAVAFAFGLGAVALMTMVGVSWFGIAEAFQPAVTLGVWGFLLPVFLAVCHRMVPFFSANVIAGYTAWRPGWLLGAFVVLSWAHGGFVLMQFNPVAVDMLFAGLLLYTSWRWRLFASFSNRLLAMLHASFAWAGVAMLLFVVQDIADALGRPLFAFAPLHALTIGFFATMLLGFVTRVTMGHSGRPLAAGAVTWTAYWLLHGVALARVASEVWPQAQFALHAAAGLGALLAFVVWAAQALPIYLKARADGQPG
ncbi:NnrS family protein [Jeongeupia chitinilytica]|uniref:Heme transporter CcmB n=1 Tax=Jeongeupia chitinilytica TaxID=1041641 RepID=A0ABQ3GYX4_9NEIS|nr:NnrS family protein [Jeongeupia chitinilytica]GHD61950.1 heme transporter CcmB [Jeongeupia chitinilytica]